MITAGKWRNWDSVLRCAIVLTWLVPWTVGCGSSSNGPAGQIRGRVTYEGEPVKEGVVSVYSSDLGSGASGNISPDGTYTISDPVRTGKYAVSVFPPPEPPPQDEVPVSSNKVYDNIPEKYRDPQKSGLVVDIKEGENTFDIDMTKE